MKLSSLAYTGCIARFFLWLLNPLRYVDTSSIFVEVYISKNLHNDFNFIGIMIKLVSSYVFDT